MKLILINRYFHPDHSATSQLLTDLALDQAARGNDVHVVTSRQRYEDASARLAASERYRGVTIHRVWTTRFGRTNLVGRAIDYASFYCSAAARLLRLAGPGDILVAKTDPPLISVVAAWVARRKRARLVNWLQDVFPEVAQKLGVAMPLAGVAKRLAGYSLRTADANVALGERMAALVAVNVRVIENWADGTQIVPVPRETNALRRQWSLDDRYVIGYSGNMGRAHEFETVLQACEALRGERDIVFLFVGAGRQREWIEREARERGLASVVFQPYQPREVLGTSLSVPDAHLVTLQPALEGLIVPSKFYGVAAAGRPTLFVGDRDGEIARIVERERCGRAVQSGDAKALAEAIRELRDEPDKATEMGRRARALFEARYAMPVALAKWDALLRSVH